MEKNPERHSYLVEEGYLPEDRAVRCGDEYEQMSNSWDTLLSPYVKLYATSEMSSLINESIDSMG
jgi:Putative metallopeptidase